MVIVANVIVMTWETYPANLGMERSKRVFEDAGVGGRDDTKLY